MNDLSTLFPLLVDDEFALLSAMVPLAGASVLDVGCGAGQMTARIARDGAARQVVGLEVDEIQLQKNRAKSWPAGVGFQRAGAQALPLENSSIDAITMFKSLHHVPGDAMATAFREMHRVLRPGGRLFISEPVYDGPFNEIVKLFHDEGAVRADAIAATGRAVADGLFTHERRLAFYAPVAFADFEEFRVKLMNPTHTALSQDPEVIERTREAFGRHQAAVGARFIRPMRIDLLVKP
ncbi:MAG TPA: class I SAM-dependent methyltransferase [Ramlibacter sp.]